MVAEKDVIGKELVDRIGWKWDRGLIGLDTETTMSRETIARFGTVLGIICIGSLSSAEVANAIEETQEVLERGDDSIARLHGSAIATQCADLINWQFRDLPDIDETTLQDRFSTCVHGGGLQSWADHDDVLNEPAGVPLKMACVESPYWCEQNTRCEFLGGGSCVVTDCGLGECSICPTFFSRFRPIKAWCSYGCVKGNKVIGGAFILHTAVKKLGPFCVQ